MCRLHYPLSIWRMPGFRHPDVVRFDGRFRRLSSAVAR